MGGIVVAVDGSDHSDRVLEWALDEAEHRQSPLRVVTVLDWPPAMSTWAALPPPPVDDTMIDDVRRQLEQRVRAAEARRGRPCGQSVHVEVMTGRPAAALVEVSRLADQLVLGSRGAGGLSRFLLGSTSSAVVHHAECPVTIIRSDSAG